MNFKKQFTEGLLTKNPVTVQLLGMCSTLAITTSLFNGIGMGLAVTIITICSNVLISALRKVIPSQIRIAAYIVIIAGFVGKSGSVSVTKDGGEIDSITGATITSRAICVGVNAALNCVAGLG